MEYILETMSVQKHRTTVLTRTAIAVLALLPTALFAQFAGVLPPPEQYRIGFESIDVDLAEQHLRYLAGPECAGRGTGQPGYMAAAAYVAAQFEEMGLEPIGDDGSYYQAVPYTRMILDPGGTYLLGPNLSVKLGQGMALSRVTGNYELEGVEVVFLNLSASAEQLPDELDLRDKAVVVTTEMAAVRMRRMLNRKRPKVIITVVDKVTEASASLRPGVASEVVYARRAPLVSIQSRVAAKLAAALGVEPRMVVQGHADGESVLSAEGDGEISLKVAAKVEQVMVPNVVGYLPGSDPELSKQYIGVGAHLDHLGVRDGVVYPGADDDGSGSTAM
ncbi:MAG: M28 family peptidase, partial [Armatimonadetes bacterium]|nr:M28 family peptidase [Armatimonadota bacterium]